MAASKAVKGTHSKHFDTPIYSLNAIKTKKDKNRTKIKKVGIVTICSNKVKYMPQFELLLAKALEDKYNIESEIYTIMNYEKIDPFVNEMSEKFDLVLMYEYFSTKSSSYIYTYFDFARKFKEKCNKPLVFGGYWASEFAQYFKEFDVFDVNINGYSIDSTADFLAHYKSDKKIVKAHGPSNYATYELDLKYLKHPKKHFNDGILWGYITSFSCPKNCTFCFANAAREIGADFRARPLGMVYRDLEKLEKLYNFDKIVLKDMNIFYDPRRAMDVLQWLKDHNKKTDVNMDITIRDVKPHVIKRLAELGIGNELYFGMESALENRRRDFNKPFTDEALHNAFKTCDEHKFSLTGNVMLGFPYQNKDEVREEIKRSVEFVQKYDSAYLVFSSFMPEYGTAIQKKFFPDLHEKLDFRAIADLYQLKSKEFGPIMYGEQFKEIPLEEICMLSFYLKRTKEASMLGHIKPFKWLMKKMQKKMERDLLTVVDRKVGFFERIFLSEWFYLVFCHTVIPVMAANPKGINFKTIGKYLGDIAKLHRAAQS